MILDTIKQWKQSEGITEETATYLHKVHQLLLQRIAMYEAFDDTYFSKSFDELVQDNRSFFLEITTAYEHSYANPRVSAKRLPLQQADIASSFYYEAITSVRYILQGQPLAFEKVLEKFLVIVSAFEQEHPYDTFLAYEDATSFDRMEEELVQQYVMNNTITTMMNTHDTNDIRYLFRYGIPIGETELAFFQLIQGYSHSEVCSLAKQMVDSYLKGFVRHQKMMQHRSQARIVLIVGLERLGKEIQCYLQEKGYQGFVGELVYQFLTSQAKSDHDKQKASFRNLTNETSVYEQLLRQYQEQLHAYQGNIIMVTFGQKPVKRAPYEPQYQQDRDQEKIVDLQKRTAFEHFVPKSNISFTGMAFPVVELCEENYEQIFHDVMQINCMPPVAHEQMQAHLIHLLDTASHVTLKGFRGNETDITIQLHPLEDPNTQTNFVNAGCDVNIPVGEVYTSPQLQGSSGLIHLQRIKIAKIQFQNVRIEVKDGFTQAYSCQNTNEEQAAHDLMEEVIFHHRKHLPIGEFALGTNTFAYALAKKDGILHQLHTLIYEKLGPHIAIGDTCFAWAEDNPSFDADGKRMVAKDNEFSIQRKQDPASAYVSLHYDLTIPYDEIGLIQAHKKDGTVITIVKDGLFVIPELEALNTYLR